MSDIITIRNFFVYDNFLKKHIEILKAPQLERNLNSTQHFYYVRFKIGDIFKITTRNICLLRAPYGKILEPLIRVQNQGALLVLDTFEVDNLYLLKAKSLTDLELLDELYK